MKKNFLYLLLFIGCCQVYASNVIVQFYDAELPLLVNKQENVVCEICIESEFGGEILEEIVLMQHGISMGEGKSARVFYSGTSSILSSRTPSQAIHGKIREFGGSQSIYCHPSYSIQKSEISGVPSRMSFCVNTKLIKGNNYFWISFELHPSVSLETRFTLDLLSVQLNGNKVPIKSVKDKKITHRVGLGIRQSGDDGVHSFRIPGLVTTNKGTLLAVYDVRHQTNIDLQEDIDIGMSRSTDKGNTWEPMKIIMDMGEYNGLPQSQNGIGDPAILIDEQTNIIWVSAVWVHGLANNRAWRSVQLGMSPEDGTGQLMMVNSKDDGLTWSKPINMTSMVKTPDMTMLLQGPGRGISMKDGTLVFPVQFRKKGNDKKGEIAIIYSKDHGQTWMRSNSVPTDYTVSEPQIAEISPGLLMINARTIAPYRFVAITDDLGENWEFHVSSGKALVESNCMGSLMYIDKENNQLGKGILLFSNPNFKAETPSMSSRRHLTIKASLDGGISWPEKYQINLDEEQGWGYSCLSLIDTATIGILYEGSAAQMVFQRIRLKDLIKE